MKGDNSLFSMINRIRNLVLRKATPKMLPVKTRGDLERLGTEYGGWVIASKLLSSESICWCVGVGEDITFDLALIDRFGCQVWGMDPTPRAIRHIETHAKNQADYHFLPIGIWSSDTTQRFYEPKNPDHVSHSIVNLQQTHGGFDAECRSVRSLMAELGHDHIDLLKLDIEGAEYVVLDSLAQYNIRPLVLCVEFDQPAPIRKVLTASRQLLNQGYELVSIDNWNFTFVLK